MSDAHAFQAVGLPFVVPAGYPLVPAGEDRGGVHRPGYGLTGPGNPAGIGDNRPQDRLARDASPVGALAPDQFPFDGRYREAGRTGLRGEGVPNRTGTDGNDVVHAPRCSAHSLSLGPDAARHIVKADSQIGARAAGPSIVQ